MRPILIATFLATVVGSTALAAGDAQDDLKGVHTLPDDPNAAVLVLDYRGGFTAGPRPEEPFMVIRAGGAVEVMKFGAEQPVKGKIAPEELRELLRFVLDENKFFDISQEGIAAAKKKADEEELAERKKLGSANGEPIVQIFRPQIADAPTTIIQAHADGKQNKISVYALNMESRQYPKVSELQHLANIQVKLAKLSGEILKGGN